ncbi:expressed unknown protein [Ectocarpus siliculosus]|uniref:Uncharacterized protein n=1 Tax=Ectocarpus siliculosus TaxID=2880 RepID=D7FMF0_ECTSI|nr:expressed unknown protein [Ectocarpus siliculosus]|eukprot:CBJ29962.1 expressed unknown protein [Ectocarpus siliculosus]
MHGVARVGLRLTRLGIRGVCDQWVSERTLWSTQLLRDAV